MSCQNGLHMLHVLSDRQVVRQEATQMSKKRENCLISSTLLLTMKIEGTDAVINTRKGKEQQLGWITVLNPRHSVCHLYSDNQDCQLFFSHIILGSKTVREGEKDKFQHISCFLDVSSS